MVHLADRPFDWVAVFAIASGVAVIIPSLTALGMALAAVVMALT
jgi:hypothetical protein